MQLRIIKDFAARICIAVAQGETLSGDFQPHGMSRQESDGDIRKTDLELIQPAGFQQPGRGVSFLNKPAWCKNTIKKTI